MSEIVRIVLADDHEIVLEGLRSLLQTQDGYEVVGEARNGTEAIEIVMQTKPDVLVLDIGMPEADGFEVTEALRSEGINSKILVLSMHDERDFVVEMFKIGADGYLLKDSALVDLLKAINTILSGKRYLSETLVDAVLQDVVNPHEEGSPFDVLTEREHDVMLKVINGLSTKEIAFELSLSPKTVDGYRQQIMKKLKIDNLVGLIRLAIRERLIDP